MEPTSAMNALQACLRAGTSEFVVCGGARNAELLAILAKAPGGAHCWNFPEERSAAFFALGRARASGKPVAVVTTSGTAAAELLPAVIEAHYQRVPLIALTADRPQRYRGRGAPQAIEQIGLFGAYAETNVEHWTGDWPLHLNVPLEEPSADELASASYPLLNPVAFPAPSPSEDATELLSRFLGNEGELLVMVGCLAPSWRIPVRDLLQALAVPVYAEATSGLREELAPLAWNPTFKPQRVLRIGGVPACRAWRDLEAQADVEVLSIAPNGLPGLARREGVQVVNHVDWQRVTPQKQATGPISCGTAIEPATPEERWLRELSERIPAGAMVFLGNSLPIREWNRCASLADRGLRCFANRGANGIDGLIATFLGMAEGEEEAWLVIGDLSVLYDLAAPWVLPQLAAGNRRIAVINNAGGKIFRQLPALAEAGDELFGLIENPHQLNFEHWAGLWGMQYQRAGEFTDLEQLPDGNVVLEIPVEA